jgi:hypothetical protein
MDCLLVSLTHYIDESCPILCNTLTSLPVVIQLFKKFLILFVPNVRRHPITSLTTHNFCPVHTFTFKTDAVLSHIKNGHGLLTDQVEDVYKSV